MESWTKRHPSAVIPTTGRFAPVSAPAAFAGDDVTWWYSVAGFHLLLHTLEYSRIDTHTHYSGFSTNFAHHLCTHHPTILALLNRALLRHWNEPRPTPSFRTNLYLFATRPGTLSTWFRSFERYAGPRKRIPRYFIYQLCGKFGNNFTDGAEF